MTSLHNEVVHPPFRLIKSIATARASILGIKKSKDTVVVPEVRLKESRKALVEVLTRAANDHAFISKLTDEGSKALQDYNLTIEEKAALLSGDINSIEANIGKLDKRLSTWLQCRLQQEIW
jgi:hypothetical protein